MLLQAHNGKAVTIYSPSVAEAKLVYPLPPWDVRITVDPDHPRSTC